MRRENDQTTYLFVAGAVAIVAIVALVLNGSLSPGGAATFGKESTDGYQEVCADDDPANDFDLAGTATLGPYAYEDYCQDGVLTQYYCEGGKNVGTTRPYLCPNGCRNGACLAALS